MFWPEQLVLRLIEFISGVYFKISMSPIINICKNVISKHLWPHAVSVKLHLPVHFVSAIQISFINGVCLKTIMSPMEHSCKHLQQTRNWYKKDCTVPVRLLLAWITDSDAQFAKTLMSPGENSRSFISEITQQNGARIKIKTYSNEVTRTIGFA